MAAAIALLLYAATFSSVLGLVAPRAVFTFGDSIFDAGNNHFNNNCTAQADFPPYGSSFFHHPTGRFTNGRTVAVHLSVSHSTVPNLLIN
ncbi:GDSL esterase/lipase 6 [Linum perenne]